MTFTFTLILSAVCVESRVPPSSIAANPTAYNPQSRRIGRGPTSGLCGGRHVFGVWGMTSIEVQNSPSRRWTILAHAGTNQRRLVQVVGDEGGKVRTPRVLIEFCTGCRWGLRAGWMSQELFVTFGDQLGEVATAPSEVGGTFNVWLNGDLLHNRTETGRFPELKEIKQKIRDKLDPERDLGHSDVNSP